MLKAILPFALFISSVAAHAGNDVISVGDCVLKSYTKDGDSFLTAHVELEVKICNQGKTEIRRHLYEVERFYLQLQSNGLSGFGTSYSSDLVSCGAQNVKLFDFDVYKGLNKWQLNSAKEKAQKSAMLSCEKDKTLEQKKLFQGKCET